MANLTLLLFACGLFACVVANISIICALIFGYILFCIYALKKGFSFSDVFKMSLVGIKTVKNILITFVLIGVLTALWRAGGTIPALVCYSTRFIEPQLFVMVAFLLNCLVSFLTGTAFGTAATMGAICVVISNTLGVNPIIMGGAVLSGAYFGDRCSPVSTSALLVSAITKTNIYKNIKNMLRTSAVPFLITCLIYLIFGFLMPISKAETIDIYGMFATEFRIGMITLVPAVLIIVMAFAKVDIKINMLTSILTSALLCYFYQGFTPLEILKISFWGFKTSNETLMNIINGGGIVSMAKVVAIVCISSAYSGFFENTDILNSLKDMIKSANMKLSSYSVILIASIFSNVFTCNQTLGIMLTEQLCKHIERNGEKLAIYLENSAVIVAPLIPWSIAATVSLTAAGAPKASMIAALFLILVPVYSLIIFRKKATEKVLGNTQ